MSQTILLFEISNEKKQRLTKLCRTLSIQAKYISPKDYKQPLGALAGIQGMPKKTLTQKNTAPGQSLGAEMLVFSGMNSKQVDDFLEAYKHQNLSPIRLKAILTPYNIRWTPLQLLEELKEEDRHHADLVNTQ